MAKIKKISSSVIQDAQYIIDRDIDRNKKFVGMDELFYNELPEPPEMATRQWFRWMPPTSPSDSVWGATRTLSSVFPQLTYAPITAQQEDKDTADKIERVLTALLRKSGKRTSSKPARQLINTAVLYDMTAMQVDFLPFMLRQKGLSDVMRRRLEKSMRLGGPFALHVRNPKNVHAVYSEWGLHKVVFEQTMLAREANMFFANKDLENPVTGASCKIRKILFFQSAEPGKMSSLC